ncbi:MAG: hypothetical protein NZ519_09390 [Bacteroidia bacterium]|nr:hypothetical protein [Bacteroidia bacterium]MDW8303002.1 hypothetical protein [Bacteroidia bacterium]
MKQSLLYFVILIIITIGVGCRAQYPKRYFKKAEHKLLQGIPDILYCYTERINADTQDSLILQNMRSRNQNIDLDALKRVRNFMRTHKFDEIILNKEQQVIHLIDHNFQVTVAFLYYYGKEVPKIEKEIDLNGKIIVEKLKERWYLKITELEGV